MKIHNHLKNNCLSRRDVFKTIGMGIGSILLSNGASANSRYTNSISSNSDLLADSHMVNQVIDTYIEKVRKRAHIPGLSIGIMREGKPILAKGYGIANLEHGVPDTEKTLYPLASITKQFTATGIMMLVEEEKIRLDNKIHKYLSNLPNEWSEITVQHLLAHTSGITCYTNDPENIKNLTRDITKEQLYDIVIGYPHLKFLPGEKWEYCNSGYVLLGYILEEITGYDYDSLLKRRIFDPLQMLDTRVNDNTAVLRGRAEGYAWRSGTFSKAKVLHMTWPFAAGDLISNVMDLAKWDRALYGDDILPPHRLKQMWAPVQLNNGSTFPYGFGWNVENINGHFCINHSGAFHGFGSCLFRFPNDKLSVVVLLNEECWIDPNPIHPAYLTGLTLAGLYEPELATIGRKALRDQSPKISELVKTFLSKFMKGQPDEDLCSEEFWNRFSNWELPYYINFLQQVGLCKSITLVDRKKQGEDITDLYQLAFPLTTFVFRFKVNGNTKISDMRLVGEILNHNPH